MTETRITRLARTTVATGAPAARVTRLSRTVVASLKVNVRVTRLLRTTVVAIGAHRDITDAVATEAKKSSGAKPVAFVELLFDSGPVRVWSGRGPIINPVDGQSYDGVGALGRISAVDEATELRAFGVTMRLSGVDPSLLAVALDEPVQGRRANIWLGFLDDSYQPIVDPVLVFRGRMDTMDVELGAEGVITVTAENRLVDWERARVRRYTDADLQAKVPGDLGLKFVAQAVEKEIVWGGNVAGGKKGGAVSSGTGGSGGSTTTFEQPEFQI